MTAPKKRPCGRISQSAAKPKGSRPLGEERGAPSSRPGSGGHGSSRWPWGSFSSVLPRQKRHLGPVRAQRCRPLPPHRHQRLWAHGLALEGAENSMPKLGDLGRSELPVRLDRHRFSRVRPSRVVGAASPWPSGASRRGRVAVLALRAPRSIAGRHLRRGRALRRCRSISCRRARCSGTSWPWRRSRWPSLGSASPLSIDPAKEPRPQARPSRSAWLGLVSGFMSRGAAHRRGHSRRSSVGSVLDGVWATAPRKPRNLRRDRGRRFALLVGIVATCLGVVGALSRNARPSIRCGSARRCRPSPSFPHSIWSFTTSGIRSFRGARSFPSRWAGSSAVLALPERATQRTIPRCGPARRACSASVGSAVAFGCLLGGARQSRIPRVRRAGAARRHGRHLDPRFRARGARFARARRRSRGALCALLRDYVMFPEKGLSAFAVNPATFPDSFKDRASTLILVRCGIFVIVVFFAWLEEQVPPLFQARRLPRVAPRARARLAAATCSWSLVALEVGLVLRRRGL